MVGSATYRTHLPADVALTEYSRKFYDGTYKWDSEGFTDETGKYHEFDCYDSGARAPTPLPPMCLSDDEADGGTVEREESAFHMLGDETNSLLSATNVKHREVVAMQRDELLRDRTDTKHTIGKMEDASPATPSKTIAAGLRDFASPSELSECPSDISEWDVGRPMSRPKTIAKKPVDEMFEQDDVDAPERKPTTRGVAQKVKKGIRKPTAASIKPSPRIETVQAGSYMESAGATTRRRSTRLNQGGK